MVPGVLPGGQRMGSAGPGGVSHDLPKRPTNQWENSDPPAEIEVRVAKNRQGMMRRPILPWARAHFRIGEPWAPHEQQDLAV